MSTYNGAYSNDNHVNGARACSCYDERVNDFCCWHGKYRDGSFKESEEFKHLKEKLAK